jgi:hypothetical protein
VADGRGGGNRCRCLRRLEPDHSNNHDYQPECDDARFSSTALGTTLIAHYPPESGRIDGMAKLSKRTVVFVGGPFNGQWQLLKVPITDEDTTDVKLFRINGRFHQYRFKGEDNAILVAEYIGLREEVEESSL